MFFFFLLLTTGTMDEKDIFIYFGSLAKMK